MNLVANMEDLKSSIFIECLRLSKPPCGILVIRPFFSNLGAFLPTSPVTKLIQERLPPARDYKFQTANKKRRSPYRQEINPT
jgi:hypothetical protein